MNHLAGKKDTTVVQNGFGVELKPSFTDKHQKKRVSPILEVGSFVKTPNFQAVK